MATLLVLLGMIVILTILLVVSLALRSAASSGKIEASPTHKTQAPSQNAESYGSSIDDISAMREGQQTTKTDEGRNRRNNIGGTNATKEGQGEKADEDTPIDAGIDATANNRPSEQRP